MTNYNFNGNNYFYTIFEFEDKGFILKEKYLSPDLKIQKQEEFFKFAEIIGDKLMNLTEQEMLEELGYLSSYKIENHKAEIITQTQGLCTVVCSSKDKLRKNIMYLLLTVEKMEDFSKVPRHDASRETLFFETLKDEYNEDFKTEIFLN